MENQPARLLEDDIHSNRKRAGDHNNPPGIHGPQKLRQNIQIQEEIKIKNTLVLQAPCFTGRAKSGIAYGLQPSSLIRDKHLLIKDSSKQILSSLTAFALDRTDLGTTITPLCGVNQNKSYLCSPRSLDRTDLGTIFYLSIKKRLSTALNTQDAI